MVVMELKDRTRVRIMIAETGKSLRTFSKDIQISQPYLSQILGGTHKPSPTIAYKIAKGLNKEIEDIFLPVVIDKTVSGGALVK